MSNSRPRVRYGAHRSGHSLLGALMPSVLAVASVAALITALAVWQGEDPGRSADAATSLSASSSRSPSTSTSSGPSAGTTSSAEPTETTATATTSTAAPSDLSPSDPTTSDLEVVVLNQTSRGGLALTVADRLRDAGWPVPAVGNFRGVVPSTTVYYPGGARPDALAVAADLPTEPRVRPRFGNLSTSRLTVVVTDTYPG